MVIRMEFRELIFAAGLAPTDFTLNQEQAEREMKELDPSKLRVEGNNQE